MMTNIQLIVLSFFASLGFAIVFQVRGWNLFFAGLGGAVTRCAYLFFTAFIQQRILFVLLAAVCASLYAEVLAIYKRMPSTIFLYPAIIPLIPGDFLYDAAMCLLLQHNAQMVESAISCILALLGMSIGFVIVSTVVYYVRSIQRKRDAK